MKVGGSHCGPDWVKSLLAGRGGVSKEIDPAQSFQRLMLYRPLLVCPTILYPVLVYPVADGLRG